MTKEQQLKKNASQRKFYRGLRVEAILHYGGKCAECGEDKIEFLVIDDTNGRINRYRKKSGVNIQTQYWLKKNKYPKGFKVLCCNCLKVKKQARRNPERPSL